jgi:hypothetical protein
MSTYRVERDALLKLLLHAAKHPSSSVNGVLLGTASGGGVHVTDAVPLFHNSLTLADSTEVALVQVRRARPAPAGSRRRPAASRRPPC